VTTVVCQLGRRIAGQVAEAVPEVDVVTSGTGEVVLTGPWTTDGLEDLVAGGARWVHNFGTGVDRFPFDKLGPDTILTCSRGAGAEPISEWVVAQLLAFEKRLPQQWLTEPPEHWNLAELGSLDRSHVAVVGLGGIGTAVARRVLPFGSEVRALRRRPLASPIDGVEVVTDLTDLVGWCDHLVLAAPSTPATHHLIDAEVLGAMGPGAHLVNIARGALVDHDALRAALDDGQVALASLDTVEPEPLPAGHWMYGHPQVHLSAHVSWSSPRGMERILELFVEELRRWQAGEPLELVVDVDAGY